MSDGLRLFVALELPASVRSALAGWCERAAPDWVRRIPPANLHLTLAFLGSRSPAEGDAVAALLAGLARSHAIGSLATAGALWLPPRRPAVLTVALGASGELAALQAGLVSALGGAIGFEAERRPFRPHVTVGRVAAGARGQAAHPLAPTPELSFHAAGLTLYRSHTEAGGARYEGLARAALGVG